MRVIKLLSVVTVVAVMVSVSTKLHHLSLLKVAFSHSTSEEQVKFMRTTASVFVSFPSCHYECDYAHL